MRTGNVVVVVPLYYIYIDTRLGYTADRYAVDIL